MTAKSSDVSEMLAVGADMNRSPTSVTTRRKISAILLGLCYGAFFLKGIAMGFSYEDASGNWLANSPTALIIFNGLSFALAGFLIAHSARSATIGIITSAADAALYFLLPG